MNSRRLLLIGFGLILFTGIAVSTGHRVYDERYHLERVDQIMLGRPWLQIFTEPTVSAVGPVFPLCEAMVALVSPDVRASRFFVLGSAFAIIGLTVFLLRQTTGKGGFAVLLFGASPFVVSGMMALTELPALVFVVGSFAMIWVRGNRWARLGISGALLALGFLTRQSSLVLALPLAAAWFMVARIRLVELAVLAAPPSAALLALLTLWGSLLPPGLETWASGFSILHVIQAAIYSAVIGCVMNPGFLRGQWPLVAIMAGLALRAYP